MSHSSPFTTGRSPGYAITFTGFDAVPACMRDAETCTFSAYVPPITYRVSPACMVDRAYCTCARGGPSPDDESEPDVATYRTVAGARGRRGRQGARAPLPTSMRAPAKTSTVAHRGRDPGRDEMETGGRRSTDRAPFWVGRGRPAALLGPLTAVARFRS